MTKQLPLIALLACAAYVSPAYADGAEPGIPSDSRMKILPYDESDVYTLTTKYGYQTNVVFAPDELIDTISMGDRSMWQIIPTGHRLFIRPMDENVTTNMTVITNKRSYQFDLKSLAADAESSPIYVAKFMYPEDIRSKKPTEPVMIELPATGNAPSESPRLVASAPVSKASGALITSPVSTNYNYTFSGDDALAPIQVFDDGVSTYITYRPSKEPLPRVFMVGRDGKKTPAVYYLKNGQMVIDAISGEWALDYYSGTITVYNEILNPQ